ncbi:hypothetical protein COCMIDRAFT_3277 [Bipolaris oryzae ATCC 44560]|uniref:Heterokaryon incompatibility domain-containing protein n=1 Tax=Bipolaris oryzae ATCC 44560 TaxID=930090 RepID=W6Z7V6_COCMI|nr:uncharacterized protein COCMIDRAFT_3277 [Bipolaris oryzae ATCC 44560]EUC47797.1 hypothetical protein COCMIDRAFT_3277 [Bipolaris oryzae ATCC 44560]
MKNDLQKTFGEIFNNDIDAFRNQLLEIQKYQCDRKESEKWVENLRFLDISKVPDLQTERLKQERLCSRSEKKDPLFERIPPSCDVPITEREDDAGDRYIAVSYKWPQARPKSVSSTMNPPVFRYQVKRPGKKSHKSEFSDHYMDRVIRYAQSVKMTKLWVDIECIYQRPEDKRTSPKDQELGVQAMDMVYGDSTHSVGILTVEIQDQREIDMLSNLLSRSLFVHPIDEDDPKLRPEVDITAVQMLILHILSDPRWSRGWIFQEDHLASQKMELLIPYNLRLDKSGFDNLGKIPGELQVKLKDFRQTVTLFCRACTTGEVRWPCTEILAKVTQYNICNKVVHNLEFVSSIQHVPRPWDVESSFGSEVSKSSTQSDPSKIYSYPTTTASVLDDISSRCLEKESDRIPILANALKCKKRLNTGEGSPLVESGTYSLSAALLTLILINGEIFKNVPGLPVTWPLLDRSSEFPTEANILSHTLPSYLNACQSLFTAPGRIRHQTFIDRCRFVSPIITGRGIETRGYLFDLISDEQLDDEGTRSDLLLLSELDMMNLSAPERKTGRRKLDDVACQVLEILMDRLERSWPNSKLVSHMRKHIELDQHPPRQGEGYASTSYVLDNMYAIYRALVDKKELRLAQLASARYDAEPVALFIQPGQYVGTSQSTGYFPHEEPVKVFASFDNGRHDYDKERLVSLKVEVCDDTGVTKNRDQRHRCLRNLGWVNGIWTVHGEKMETFVFPLPGITKEGGDEREVKSNAGKKRKREDIMTR